MVTLRGTFHLLLHTGFSRKLINMDHLKFYIDGAWVDPVTAATIDVINPATEKAFTQVSAGSAADIDRAVAAARSAFAENTTSAATKPTHRSS